jgi:hypothetical protein
MKTYFFSFSLSSSPLSRNFFPPFGLAACRGREASSLPPPGFFGFFVSSLYPFRAREVRVSQPLGLFGVSSLPRNYSGGGVLPSLVRLDYGGLCSFFSFLFLWLTGKHLSEASEGEIPPFLWLAEVLVGSQFFHPLKPDLRCSTAPQATRAPFPCSSSSSDLDAAFYGRGAQR